VINSITYKNNNSLLAQFEYNYIDKKQKRISATLKEIVLVANFKNMGL
jgi:hypothetical protein